MTNRTPPQEGETETGAQRALRIVHLEDSDDDAEIVQAILDQNLRSVQVERVVSREGFDAAMAHPVDLVLSDFEVPGFGAPELIEELRRRGDDTPVIVVSGAIGEDAALTTLRAGAVDFLLKDRLARLPSAVVEAMRARRQTRQVALMGKALEASVNGIVIARVDSGDQLIEYVNPAFERITGYTREEAIGRNCRFLQGSDRDQSGIEQIRMALARDAEVNVVLRNYRKDGSLFWNDLRIAPIPGADGKVTHFVGVSNDITLSVEYQGQLERQANYDELTGLANRNLMRDRLAQGLAYAQRLERVLGVLCINLDNLKHINNSFGHAAGDAILQEWARRLQRCVRDGDTTARLVGDSFVILLPDLVKPEDVLFVVRRIEAQCHTPHQIDGQDLFLSCSIGVSVFPRDGGDVDTLMRNAESALHRAKEGGRAGLEFYTPELNERARGRVGLEAALHRALEREEIFVQFQPKVDLRSGALVGAEALVRWRHPERGLVSPATFIPLAEETGLIVPLGERVLQLVAGQMRAWRDEGLGEVRVAVNVSARQLAQPGLVETVARTLSAADIDPALMDIEVTESAVASDAESFVQRLESLKVLGVGLSIDDFGTGYSSLSYLRRFPIDSLKIDQSFVRDIGQDAGGAVIADVVIKLGHALGLKVIAEGVETAAQADYLRAQGCDYGQGYLFGRPMPAGEFAAWAAQHRAGGR